MNTFLKFLAIALVLTVLALSAWRTWQETPHDPEQAPLATEPQPAPREAALAEADEAMNLLRRFELENDADALGRATASAKSALVLDPESPQALLVAGLVHDARAEFEAARGFFARLRLIEPTSALGYLAESNSYLPAGELGAALHWLQQAQALAPRNFDFSGGLVLLNDSLDDPFAARQWSQWLDRRITNEPMSMALQARHHYLSGNFEAALQTSNIALNLDLPADGHADAIFMRIKRDEALGLGQPAAGIELFARQHPALFEASPEIMPGNIMQAVDLAHLHQLAGQEKRARLLTRAAIEAYAHPWFTSGSARAWLVPARAEALAVAGDSPAALDELQRIVDQGWRLHWRFETEMNPNFQALRNHAKFQALIAAIAADMSRQREALLAGNDSPGCTDCGMGGQ